MSSTDPFAPAALNRSVPRYTSYPTAPHFGDAVDPETYARWLSGLAADARLSLYVHIPFCERLCWFCACRTQGAKSYRPVAQYLDTLECEIETVAAATAAGRIVGQVHWGGGSPSTLAAEDVLRLSRALARAFPGAGEAGLEVELDPRDMTPARLDAFAEAGLRRASIGVQDFDERVQRAIGRLQGEESTRATVDGLRARGVPSVSIDLVYGLPHQTLASIGRTLDAVVALEPDRLSLFGYAHVPWMSRRQQLIDAAALPGTAERRAQAALARERLTAAGYVAVGIDHFAKPGDAMARAAREGWLRRNFQGYTTDTCDALVGLGASAIGRLPQGYVQNVAATAEWRDAVEGGTLPVGRGVAFGLDDRIRADVIERLLCRFEFDADALRARYGDMAGPVLRRAEALERDAPAGALDPLGPGRRGFRIAEAWREHTRLVAAAFDAHLDDGGKRHSLAV